jgi:hypothetical protein
MHHAGMVEAGHSVPTGQPAAMTMQHGMAVAIAGGGDHGQHDPGTNHDVLHLCLATCVLRV